MNQIPFLLAILLGLIEIATGAHHTIVVGSQDWEQHETGEKREECADDSATSGTRSNEYGDDIGVQCCYQDGSGGFREGLIGDGVDADGCLQGVDFNRSTGACQDKDARLCTKAEVEGHKGKGSGCSHDARHVWTSDSCEPPPPSPPKTGEAHMIVVGNKDWVEDDSGNKEAECAADSDTSGAALNEYGDEIGVQCCTQDGSRGYRQGLGEGGGTEDYDGYNDCLKGVDFDTAKQICEANGDRLCTQEEVEDNVGAGSGCSHDARHVWTSTNCRACDVCENEDRLNDISIRVDGIEQQLNNPRRRRETNPGRSTADSSIFAQNQIKDDAYLTFIFSNSDIVIISLLILNTFTIIVSLCVCWRNGLFGKNKGLKYSKVNFDSDTEDLQFWKK